MIINFRQGVVSYPITIGQQTFLTRSGLYVNLQTANGPTNIAFAHGMSDYLYTESLDVPNAWGPLSPSTEYWLYWDIDLLTAIRTFGLTTQAPTHGTSQPVGIDGDHWFNTTTNKMYTFTSGRWREVIRVFAAKILTNGTFSPLGNLPSKPFAGSQPHVNTPNARVGHIIADTTGNPIRRSNGSFFTVEDDFFVNGSPINSQRLESSIIQAAVLQNVAKFQVVKFSLFGKVSLATYSDIQTTIIAISFEDLGINEVGDFCVQGVVTNPDWNFTTVGVELWVTSSGLLTESDPHVTDPISNPNKKPPIARVLSSASIFFDQGLGGIGATGATGLASTLATNIIYGISKLSVAAIDANNPIVVGDNDPRLIPGSLDSLSNVVVPTPSVGDQLEWNGTSWINIAPPPQMELASTSEIDAGINNTKAMPVDQFVASDRNVRHILFRVLDKNTIWGADGTVAVGGDLVIPFVGTIVNIAADVDVAGVDGTAVVDVNINGSTIMAVDKLKWDSAEKSTRTYTGDLPSITTTSVNVGDIITLDIDTNHTTTNSKGLTLYLAIRLA
jgi:hypothetical protein